MDRSGFGPFLRKHGLHASASLAAALLVSYFLYPPLRHLPTTVEIVMQVSGGGKAQVFFDTGRGFSQEESLSFRITGRENAYVFTLPRREVRAWRIDPMDVRGEFSLDRLTFENRRGRLAADPSISARWIVSANEATYTFADGVLRGRSLGKDPYLVLRRPDLPTTRGMGTVLAIIAAAAGLSIAIVQAGFRLLPKNRRARASWSRLKTSGAGARRLLDGFGGRISERHLIIIDGRTILLCAACLVFFATTVAFTISGSSFGMWDLWVPQENVVQSPLLGSPKAIRSDEWKEVPAELHEDAHRFSWRGLLSPRSWGYYLLGSERGYAFAWNYDRCVVVMGLFFLLMLLTNSNFPLALLGALWAHFSAFSQWWGSLSSLGYGSVLFLGCVYFLFSKKRPSIVLGAALVVIYGQEFALGHLYPPWQVPAGYLLLFVLAGYGLGGPDRGALRCHARLKAGLAVIGLAFLALLGAALYPSLRDMVDTISQTVYPGLRRSAGGMSVLRYFAGFFDVFLREGDFPAIYANVCEASGFILLFPLVCLPLMWRAFTGRSRDRIQLSVMAYIAFISTWMLFDYPPLVARLTMLDRVPPTRAFIGLGVASIILTILFLNDKAAWRPGGGRDPRLVHGVVSVAVMIALGWYGYLAHQADAFYRYRRIMAVVAIYGLAAYALSRKKTLLFSLVILVLVSPHLLVQPVSSGFDSVVKKDIVTFARAIEEKDRNAAWIVFGNPLPAKLLRAGAAQVFNARSYPDRREMTILDPEDRYKNIWNRYSAFMPVRSVDRDDIAFSYTQADLFGMEARPDNPALQKIGIKYFVFTYPPIREDLNGFRQLNDRPLNGMWVFRREKDDDTDTAMSRRREDGTGLYRFKVDPAVEKDGYVEVSGWVSGVERSVDAVFIKVDEVLHRAVSGMARPELGDPERYAGFAKALPISGTEGHREYSIIVAGRTGGTFSAFGPYALP